MTARAGAWAAASPVPQRMLASVSRIARRYALLATGLLRSGRQYQTFDVQLRDRSCGPGAAPANASPTPRHGSAFILTGMVGFLFLRNPIWSIDG